MKIFGREPALILALIAAVLSFAGAAGLPVSSEQAALVVAAVNAVFGVVAALTTRPIAPTAFTALVTALAALAAGFGLHIAPDTLGALNAVIIALLALQSRGQVAPVLAHQAQAQPAGQPATS